MPHRINRRDLLKSTAAASVGYLIGSSAAPLKAEAANEKLNVAFIGIGGRGRANLDGIAAAKQNVVALCDVDQQRAGNAFERFPKAQRFYDFRRMLDDMEKEIDAVVVSTPDHTHYHPAMVAMQRGKHLYCEKPMAHSVFEARSMTEAARKHKVATQLGVQRHTITNMHRVVELVQAGAIGRVSEVHSWIGGTRGMPKSPSDFPAVPSHLKWDLWLGPRAERRYSPEYCPYNWRFWWDFGTGETGNWGCHILDIPYWALGLTHPTKVAGSGPPVHEQTTPKSMATRMEFPAVADRGPVTLHWHHANKGPAVLAQHGLSDKGANTLFIGSEGMLLCGFNMRKLLPEKKFAGFEPPIETIPKSPGFYREWIDACKGGPAATCNFDYSGPLSETVLLGNVGYRVGGEFGWNADQLTAAGNDNVAQFIQEPYRKGWEVLS